MPPDMHIVVPISVTVILTIASFIVGVLVNLVTMRSIFVSSKSCEECRRQCSDRNGTITSSVKEDLFELKSGQKNLQEQLYNINGDVRAIASRFKTRTSDQFTKTVG